MQWLPIGQGRYVNASAILWVVDQLDGTPIIVNFSATLSLQIDPTANPLIAAAFRRRLAYVNLPPPQGELPPAPSWNPSPPMPAG